MISIRVLASILILFHIASDFFIGSVLLTQFRSLKIDIDPGLRPLRRTLISLASIIFLGNIVPIIIDGITILGFSTKRPQHLAPISVTYSMSNAIVAVGGAFLVWYLYRLAANTKLLTDRTEQDLQDQVDAK